MADDVQKIVNIIFIGFVLFIVIVMVILARVVSTFMAKNQNKSTTQALASAPAAPIENAHTLTVHVTRAAESYLQAAEHEKAVKYEILLTLAQSRKHTIDTMLDDNPISITAILFSEDLRGQLPEELRSLIERPVIMEGTVKKDTEGSQLVLINRTGEEYALLPVTLTQEKFAKGSRLRVTGILIDNKIVVKYMQKL